MVFVASDGDRVYEVGTSEAFQTISGLVVGFELAGHECPVVVLEIGPEIIAQEVGVHPIFAHLYYCCLYVDVQICPRSCV